MTPSVSVKSPMISEEFFWRIQRSYCKNVDDFSGYGDSMWDQISSWRNDVHEVIYKGDLPRALKLLLNPLETRLYWGVDSVCNWSPAVRPKDEVFVAWAYKSIQDLAMILGVDRVTNPEGGTTYAPGTAAVVVPYETLLDGIDKAVGARIDFPNPFNGEAGLETSRGIACAKALNAVYQANQLARMMENDVEQNVLEIGAGLGRTAYYSKLMDIKSYTIVDLPLALVGQAVFLGLVLGEDAVSFGGEEDDGNRIRLLSPAQFNEDQRTYPFVLNADSLPEMDRLHVQGYFLRMMKDRAKFLSINHEANVHTVHELAPIGFQISRNIYALRAGYVEEHFDFSKR